MDKDVMEREWEALKDVPGAGKRNKSPASDRQWLGVYTKKDVGVPHDSYFAKVSSDG